ncbi:MAG: hypothetical protein K8823_747 [Cenarchaeum symbiont of Oopsacas minuta]|nr:hypothetical protein [Cenarchaeum symbiont of Oopsacas minuta]
MATRTTKKDLEAKIALLEKKLQKLTESIDLEKTSPKPKVEAKPAEVKPKGTLPKGTIDTKPAEVKPKGTTDAPKLATTKPKGVLPKGFEEKPAAPKPAKVKNAPSNMAQALETAYQNWPMTNTADYKAKTPGYTPAGNRYFARQHAVIGKVTTRDWNLQKKAITGYTAPSDQYFATKQRLAYHPADKNFNSFGIKVDSFVQQAPPKPKVEAKPAEVKPKGGSLPKGFKPSTTETKAEVKPAEVKPKGGALPKGFKPATAKSKGTLPKGF